MTQAQASHPLLLLLQQRRGRGAGKVTYIQEQVEARDCDPCPVEGAVEKGI